MMHVVSSTEMPAAKAVSSRLGSEPFSWNNWRCTPRTRPIVSIMCTGTRIVRLWSAIARVMAWRIHQVA